VSARLVSIIGPPAVGKTTLAELLSGKLPAEMIREDYAGNPFLAESYVGDDSARLPSQLYFLFSRVRQLAEVNWPKEGLFVSDYGFCQDRVFAACRLLGKDMPTYDELSRMAEETVHPPDVMIHLDAAEATLLERIRLRGRPFEAAMTAEFLRAMRNRYNGAAAAAGCPVIELDCDAVDFRDEGRAEEIAAEIRRLT